VRYPAAETAEKHQRILDEATRLFRDRGFDGVNISEIMKSAGLTHGSFYNHFESKNDLISACVVHGATRSLADMELGEGSVAGKKAYVDNYLSIAHRDDPGSGCLMSALASEIRREPVARGALTRFVHAFVDKLATRCQRRGLLARDPARGRRRAEGRLPLATAARDGACRGTGLPCHASG
jgi:TetR/AcrR family transcriptional repressor of nem operon